MNTIEWRKWDLNDFELFYYKNKKIPIESFPVDISKFKRLLNLLVIQNKRKILWETNPCILRGFNKRELLNLTVEDIRHGDNSILKTMLLEFEKNSLSMLAPLVEISNEKYYLIDGNYRCVFAKILKIPIKVQVVDSFLHQLAKKTWSHYKLG